MTKILLYAHSFPPSIGGGEEYNLNLATGLVRRGLKVLVLTPSPQSGTESYPFNVIQTKSSLIGGLPEIRKAIKYFSPDILHISGPTPVDYYLLFLARQLKIKSILTYHADFPSFAGFCLNSFFFIFQRWVNRILVQNLRDKNRLINRGIRDDKIRSFAFNGVRPDLFRVIYDNINRNIDITFVGRMDKAHSYKGYWQFLNILKEIKFNTEINPTVCVIGGGEDFHIFQFEALKSKLDLSFKTNISTDELVSILNKSKTIVLPSTGHGEGFGRVILEGAFCGTIPVVSKFAGASDIVKGYNIGLIIDPYDTKKTASDIVNLIYNQARMNTFRKNIQIMLQNGKFTTSWAIDKTIEVYKQVLEI
ncbi:MAG: glycosyltransferase family 4 protein [Thermoplasmatales archaeon]